MTVKDRRLERVGNIDKKNVDGCEMRERKEAGSKFEQTFLRFST